MSRFFVRLYEEEFKEKVNTIRHKYCDEDDYAWPLNCPQIYRDIKVSFDFENFEERAGSFGPQRLMGYRTLKNGMNILGLCAGGDWEEPVFFILYWDGKKIRGYVPTKGNPWNTKTMQAYGNDYPEGTDDDNKALRDDLPINKNFDEDMIEEDIMNRIKEKRV